MLLWMARSLLELMRGNAWQRRVLRIVVVHPVRVVLRRVHNIEIRNVFKVVSKKSIRSGIASQKWCKVQAEFPPHAIVLPSTTRLARGARV
jgi:hypothetical protein